MHQAFASVDMSRSVDMSQRASGQPRAPEHVSPAARVTRAAPPRPAARGLRTAHQRSNLYLRAEVLTLTFCRKSDPSQNLRILILFVLYFYTFWTLR
jgi:hypothetical protein